MGERAYTWEDPAATVAAGLELGGLAYARAMVAGELPHPPICATIGFRIVEADEGRCVIALEPGEHQLNPLGIVHGSVIVAALDSASGMAVHTTLPARVGYSTVDLTTNFLRALRADSGTVTCEGTVLNRGRRIAVAQASLLDGDGRLCAHAVATCMILTE